MVNVGTGTAGTRFLKTNYPYEEGLDAGTTKQEGTQTCLIADIDLIPDKEKVGVEY